MTHKDAGQAGSGEHATEDLQPSALIRELHLALKEYGKDRVCGVPLVLLPEGLYERTVLALNSHASLSAEKEALQKQLDSAIILRDGNMELYRRTVVENATLRAAAEKAATGLEALAAEYAKVGVTGVCPSIAANLRRALYRKGP